MAPDSNSNDPVRQLQFYCRECDVTFETHADGSGYEQARCPACMEMCLTVEFEEDEQRRNQSEAQFANALGSLFGVGWVGPCTQFSNRQDRYPASEMITLTRYMKPEDAETDAQFLDKQGFHVTIVVNDSTSTAPSDSQPFLPVELQVPARAAIAARQALESLDLPEPQKAASAPEDNVTFPCEECGKPVTFPGHCRGKVEVCPHCAEYVDVPEPLA